jgi:hypothetical protein
MKPHPNSKAFQWPQPRPKHEWLTIPGEVRWPWSEQVFIDHPDVKAVVEDSWTALAHVQRNRRSISILALGESGSGKTRLADAFIGQTNALYGRDDPERTIVPAFKLEIPDGCTPRGLCVAILYALGDPMAEKRKVNLTKATAALLKACEVKVIVIDNLQDIPSRRGARGIEQVGVRLRELIDQTQCLWLLLGTRSAAEVVDSESQLIKRVAYRKQLQYFSIGNEAKSKRFRRLLNRLDEWLPMAERNTDLFARLAGKIFLATEGVLDRVEKLLDGASWEAVMDGREKLDESDFLQGFRTLYGPDVANPFEKDFATRRLNGVDEPFENLAAPTKTSKDGAKRKPSRYRRGRPDWEAA